VLLGRRHERRLGFRRRRRNPGRIETFAAFGVYGASVITALTAQNTKGVFAVHEVPADFITAQIDAVFSDLDVGAVKIGMLGNAAAIEAVAAGLVRHGARNVVLDPVMAATSGERLLRADALALCLNHWTCERRDTPTFPRRRRCWACPRRGTRARC